MFFPAVHPALELVTQPIWSIIGIANLRIQTPSINGNKEMGSGEKTDMGRLRMKSKESELLAYGKGGTVEFNVCMLYFLSRMWWSFNKSYWVFYFSSQDSRIQSFLESYLASGHQKSLLGVPGGLSPIQKELEEIAVKYVRLVDYNKMVFSPYYDAILSKILNKEASSQLWRKPENIKLICTLPQSCRASVESTAVAGCILTCFSVRIIPISKQKPISNSFYTLGLPH